MTLSFRRVTQQPSTEPRAGELDYTSDPTHAYFIHDVSKGETFYWAQKPAKSNAAMSPGMSYPGFYE